MHPILPLAALTLVAGSAFYGWLLWMWSGRKWWWLGHLLAALPLSAAINILVKAPIGRLVQAAGHIDPTSARQPLWFYAFALMLAPLTEEAVKVAPLLLRRLRRPLGTPRGALLGGMALGVGFGLGEAAYLAVAIARSGTYTQYAWYLFTGFLNERLVTMLLHAVMVGTLLVLAQRGRPLLGYAAAVGLHALTNLGALLYQMRLVSGFIANIWLLLVLIGMALLLQRLWRVTLPAEEGAQAGSGDAQHPVYWTREG